MVKMRSAIAKTRKKPNCPSTDEWISKMFYIHIYMYIQWNIA